MLHGGGPGYFSTVKSVMSQVSHPNLLVMWYEDMKRDERKMVRLIAEHVGKRITDDQVQKLADFMSFDSYKKVCSLDHPLVLGKVGGQFLRLGVVGDSVNYFTTQMNNDWDPWVEEEMGKLGLNDRILSE